MVKSVNLVSNLVKIREGVSYLQCNSLFRKVLVVATSGYIEGHKDRIPKQLTVFSSNDVSHRRIFANMRNLRDFSYVHLIPY